MLKITSGSVILFLAVAALVAATDPNQSTDTTSAEVSVARLSDSNEWKNTNLLWTQQGNTKTAHIPAGSSFKLAITPTPFGSPDQASSQPWDELQITLSQPAGKPHTIRVGRIGTAEFTLPQALSTTTIKVTHALPGNRADLTKDGLVDDLDVDAFLQAAETCEQWIAAANNPHSPPPSDDPCDKKGCAYVPTDGSTASLDIDANGTVDHDDLFLLLTERYAPN